MDAEGAMLDQVRSVVAEVAARFGDSRLHYFHVEATPEEGNSYLLSGAVLDPPAYAAVADTLLERFPDLCFDASEVQVLRTPTPAMLEVVTNVTGLYVGPSFASELAGQLLNGWPLELLLDRTTWAFVRLNDGYLGWVYRAYLAGPPALEPTHIVAAPVSTLHESPAADAPLVTRVMGGTRVAVSTIEGDWAHLALAGDLAGWAAGADLRALGALPFDEIARRRQIIADAERLIGVPYLWGGGTALGIDCSGFTRLVHRLSGVELPSDADMQFAAGRPVEPPYQPGDLLFFREAGSSERTVTHTGLSLGGWQMIHSSRARNGVYVDEIQAVPRLREAFVGARTYLRS